MARNEINPILKEKYQKRREEINVPDKPIKDWVREKALKSSLELSRKRFDFEQNRRRFEAEQTYLKESGRREKTMFVGFLKTVKIE